MIEIQEGNELRGILFDGEKNRIFKSKKYNWTFSKENGYFSRWGTTKDEDPESSDFGPEILDLEVSTICHGPAGVLCTHCYKSNTSRGVNMSLETFKQVHGKIPKNLTQIAFGIGDIDSNPELFDMFEYCRENEYNQVIPNVTVNGWGITNEHIKKLVKYCGAVAVSRYKTSIDSCYDTIYKLLDSGLEQTNIHMLLSEETYDDCFEVANDFISGKLGNLNAIVFLLLKPKGNRNKYNGVKLDKFKKLVEYCMENNVPIGFDSCSAPFFLKSVQDSPDFSKYKTLVEACESSRFSAYINVEGRYFHCSFTEGEDGWEGVDVLNCDDFLIDVWFAKETKKFRGKLSSQCHSLGDDCKTCPIFDNLYSGETF